MRTYAISCRAFLLVLDFICALRRLDRRNGGGDDDDDDDELMDIAGSSGGRGSDWE
jgi:hypothetical protein